MKYLKLYEECCESGKLPITNPDDYYANGLCYHIDPQTLGQLSPTDDDRYELSRIGLSVGFWASGLSIQDEERNLKFTPLRANILLLAACIEGEL